MIFPYDSAKNNLHGVQVHYVKFCLLLDYFPHVLNCKLHLYHEPHKMNY